MKTSRKTSIFAAGLIVVAALAHAHGDVSPQAVNTDALPDVGEEWLTETRIAQKLPVKKSGSRLLKSARRVTTRTAPVVMASA